MAPYDQQGARDMYLNTNFTQKEIADKLGIDPKTIYLWIKKGKWDEMKAAARQAPGIIQQQLYNHITAINDSIATRDNCVPTFQEVEMLRKLIVSTKHMQQMSLGTYIQAFQELTAFIGPHTNDLEFTKRVAVVADEYIKGLIHNKQFHISEKVCETAEAIKETGSDGADHVNPSDQVDHGSGNANPQVCHPGAGRNSHTSIPDDTTKSGNEEKEPRTATASHSTTSRELRTTSLPDSVALPDQEIVAPPTPEPAPTEGRGELEKRTRAIEQTITREDYIKYEHLLEEKTGDLTETINFNGINANLMTVQYNLKQFEQPEYRRQFLSREEVHERFLKYGCC